MTIGEKIKFYRLQKELTQKQFSKLSGISEISIRKYEAGERIPKIANIEKLALALEISIAELYGYANDSEVKLGDRLAELRKNLGYSQIEFAKFLEIPQPSLSAYENNKNDPTISVLINIAKKSNTSLDWICGLSDVIQRKYEYFTSSGYDKTIGLRLKKLRKEKNLTQIQFAELLGKSLRTIQKYEHGEIEIPLANINDIATTLNTTTLYLLGYGG